VASSALIRPPVHFYYPYIKTAKYSWKKTWTLVPQCDCGWVSRCVKWVWRGALKMSPVTRVHRPIVRMAVTKTFIARILSSLNLSLHSTIHVYNEHKATFTALCTLFAFASNTNMCVRQYFGISFRYQGHLIINIGSFLSIQSSFILSNIQLNGLKCCVLILCVLTDDCGPG